MNRLAFTAVLILTHFLSGCIVNPPRKDPPPTPLASPPCQTQPSSFVTGQDGKFTAAIFACYRADGVMTYEVHKLTDEEVTDLTAAFAPKVSGTAAAPKVTVSKPTHSQLKEEYAAAIRRGNVAELARERELLTKQAAIQREVDRQRAESDRAFKASRQ